MERLFYSLALLALSSVIGSHPQQVSETPSLMPGHFILDEELHDGGVFVHEKPEEQRVQDPRDTHPMSDVEDGDKTVSKHAEDWPKASDKADGFKPIPRGQVGLLVTAELEKALRECEEKVERIAKSCRKSNKKFRDIEFDLEKDKSLTNDGLWYNPQSPPDVRRVTEIFEKPTFFVGEPGSNDIFQGYLGDCWFLSALSTLTTAPHLIHKCCVARDEEVGVYGFIFFRDSYWTSVVIDDQLFYSLPKFEELNKAEQELYHDDKETYNKMAIKNGKGLHFAKSGASGETWVPLMEKAFAKLHGDFTSLAGGRTSEGIEDLTGGVSVMLKTADILDPDRFWNEELLEANNHTRLFGVSFPGLDEARSGVTAPKVRGLVGGHAYSVLRVKEINGKRFIVLRNPWGKSEWTGPWSDGSKEWTGEWIRALRELDHVMGDDGEFVMEYSDFLETWLLIQRTKIFDENWIMSSHWLRVPPQPSIYPWTHGDVIFYFTLPNASTTIIVLSQLDGRYFKPIASTSCWNLDFAVYKRGERECRGESYTGDFCQRSVSCELELEAGDYVVYPRLDRSAMMTRGYFNFAGQFWDHRKLGRVLTERTKSRSLALNYDLESKKRFIPQFLPDVIKLDLSNVQSAISGDDAELDGDGLFTTMITTTTIVTEEKKTKSVRINAFDHRSPATEKTPAATPVSTSAPPSVVSPFEVGEGSETGSDATSEEVMDADEIAAWALDNPGEEIETGDDEDAHTAFLGLKVYTKDAVVIISGKVRDSE